MLIVSSCGHPFRIRFCCRPLLPGQVHIKFLAAPETGETAQLTFSFIVGSARKPLLNYASCCCFTKKNSPVARRDLEAEFLRLIGFGASLSVPR